MADRDGITGTFYWTPPSDDIPPVTITVSSTVMAGRIETTPMPEAPKEATQPAEEVEQQGPKEFPRIPPESPVSVPQIAPQETPKTLLSGTQPVASSLSEPTNVALRLAPLPASQSIATLITLTSSTWNPPVSTASSSSSSEISTPQPHATKVLTISLSSGGAILAVAFIAVMLYTRHYRKQLVSRRTAIKGRIGHPIVPPPPQQPPMQQIFFPRDVKTYEPEEPEEPEEPITPVAPLSFGTRTRTRAVSSVYGSDQALHARDTVGNFSGTPYSHSSIGSSSSSSSRSGDMFDARGPFDPDPDPDFSSPPLQSLPPLYPRLSRNLTGSRRSSVFSNYRPRLEERESWGGMDGIGEDDEDGDMGETWEAQRRRIFQE